MTPHQAPSVSLPPTPILPSRRDLYYGGAWRKPKAGRYGETFDPATGRSLGPVAEGDAEDVDAAVAAAAAGFRDWRRAPPLE
ncbi:MAG: aldehyde dehydrogenase family protein, partial [Rhodoplanes sp.]